ncbi:MAG: AAA family ATPase [Candidatus Hodarchaeota archaeon]
MDKATLYMAIDQAFLPAKEIEAPDLFIGREEEIVQGLHALRSKGASLCIYGQRGVGKTSIAKQLRLVAAGYSRLTDLIGRPDLFVPKQFNLPSVYFGCDQTIRDINDLFRKLLSDRDSFNGICKYNEGVILERTKTRKTDTAKLALKIIGASSSEEKEVEKVVAEIDPVSAFKSVTAEIVDSADTESMIVVIDDFELLADKIGIASIIRTSPVIKFILVGVAEDFKNLVVDHQSVKRNFAEGIIKISPMTEEMLVGILRRAESLLKKIKFEKEVISSIVSLANGYPHWVHLLGKASCIDTVERNNRKVKLENFYRGIERVVKNDPDYDEIYKRAASESRELEMTLKFLAFDKSEEQNLTEISGQLDSRGVDRIISEKCVKTLTDMGILNHIRSGFCIFNDILFKGYVGIRPPLYEGNTKDKLLQESMISTGWVATQGWEYEHVVNWNNLHASYQNAADLLGTAVQLDEDGWAVLSSGEKKPILYNNKGRPIKKPL